MEARMTTETSTVDQLRSQDAAIDEAASDGDFAALESALADDFIYTHSTGKVESKAVWIEGLKPLTGKRRRVASEIAVELHGDVAVVMGDVDINWADGRTVLNRYVRVYRNQGGRWQAISQRTLKATDRGK
jgi:ketosteroid isomerase-like protein